MFPLTTVSASVLGEDHPGEIAGGLFNGSGADMEIKTRSDANAHAWRVGVAFFVGGAHPCYGRGVPDPPVV